MYNIEEITNKIINEDCITVMKLIPDNSIDLVITSPPYNIGLAYDIYKDNLPWNDYLAWCNLWIKEMYRILKPDGRYVINVLMDINMKGIRQQPMVDFVNILKYNKLQIHGIGVWTDCTRVKFSAWGSWKSASSPYLYNAYESLIIGYKDRWKHDGNPKDNILSKEDFMEGVMGHYNFGTARNKYCKAVFPIKLPTLFIKMLSYKEDIVLDMFSGSGTTALAAKQLNRKYIGIEISKNYCEHAVERLNRDEIVALA